MSFDHSAIRQRLKNVLETEGYDDETKIHDIVFHMTDWLGDLERWSAFCREPETLTDDEVIELLFDFLIHVPNHVAAASKLAVDRPVSDIFNVNAVE